MKNKLHILLTVAFISLTSLTIGLNAYWVEDENGHKHWHNGVVSDSAHFAGNVINDTDYAIGNLFGAHRYDYPSSHHCRHHPYDPSC